MVPTKKEYDKLNELFKDLFYDIAQVTVEKYQNVYDVRDGQLKITPLYRVLFCKSCAGVDVLTVITDDFDPIGECPIFICAKRTNNYKRKTGYDSWKKEVKGLVYKTIPKVNIKVFLERLKNEMHWTWDKIMDYHADGTGQADTRIKEVLQSIVIKLPMKKGWQGLNNHVMAVTNSSAGKTGIFERLTGTSAPKSFSESGLFGGVSGGVTSVGQLNGTGAFAFDEYLKKFDNDHAQMLSQCLKYMTQGTTTRVLNTGKGDSTITCIGTKTLCFFANPVDKSGLPGFSSALYPLCGRDGIDAGGTRLGHILYGDDYNKITTTEESPLITQKINFIISEMEKIKSSSISKVLDYFKPWITTKDEEYEQYWHDIKKYSAESAMKKFFDNYLISWKRIKTGAVRRAILMKLPCMFEMSLKSFITLIKPDVYTNYEKFKTWNYRSFEDLFHSKKAIVLGCLAKEMTYTQILLENGWNTSDLPLPTYNAWSWEYKKDLRVVL